MMINLHGLLKKKKRLGYRGEGQAVYLGARLQGGGSGGGLAYCFLVVPYVLYCLIVFPYMSYCILVFPYVSHCAQLFHTGSYCILVFSYVLVFPYVFFVPNCFLMYPIVS